MKMPKMPRIPNPLKILTKGHKTKTAEELAPMRHTLAHLLGAAVLELYPGTKLTIGPAIENGFYYDFEFTEADRRRIDADLPKIENKMRELLPAWTSFTSEVKEASEVKKLFPDNPNNLDLINELVGRGEEITLYTSGNFTDLC